MSRTRIPSPPKTVCPFLVLGMAVFFLVSSYHRGACSGHIFSHVWSGGVMIMAVHFMGAIKHRTRLPLQIIATVCAGWALYWTQYFNIMGAGFASFSLLWLVGWNIQEKQSSKSTRILGTLAGCAFLIVGLLLLASQIASLGNVRRMLSLNPDSVVEIVVTPGGEGEPLKIADPIQLSAIAQGLTKSLPYYANHEGFNEEKAWTMQISSSDFDDALRFTFVLGNKADKNALWMKLDNGGDFFSRELGETLDSIMDLSSLSRNARNSAQVGAKSETPKSKKKMEQP